MGGIIVKTGLLAKNVIAMTVFPFIFINKDEEISEEILRHEKIHIKQQVECFVIPFYLLYLFFYLRNLLWKSQNSYKAYKDIPFEREAHENSSNVNYLKDRELYSWTKY